MSIEIITFPTSRFSREQSKIKKTTSHLYIIIFFYSISHRTLSPTNSTTQSHTKKEFISRVCSVYPTLYTFRECRIVVWALRPFENCAIWWYGYVSITHFYQRFSNSVLPLINKFNFQHKRDHDRCPFILTCEKKEKIFVGRQKFQLETI